MLPLACLSLCWCVCWGGCLLVGVYANGVVCIDVAGRLGLLVDTLTGDEC